MNASWGVFALGLCLHATSLMALGMATKEYQIIAWMPLLSAGASALPILLGYLSEQVDVNEIGALQGGADTLRTLSGIVGNPLMSSVFAHCIKDEVQIPGGALFVAASCSALGALIFYKTEFKELREKRRKEKYEKWEHWYNMKTAKHNPLDGNVPKKDIKLEDDGKVKKKNHYLVKNKFTKL